jgi:hypothetical protein
MSLAVMKIYTGYRLEDIPPGALNQIEASKTSLSLVAMIINPD